MLTRKDILDLDFYNAIREEKKSYILGLKKHRKVHVGSDITFYFENFYTIWWQVHEMLRIEKGGESQVTDELNAYNPLIPKKTDKGYELIATLMIEIDDPLRRSFILKQLFGIDNYLEIEFNSNKVIGTSIEPTEERNREADHKTSSVHFIKWVILNEHFSDFLNAKSFLKITHPHYNYFSEFSNEFKNSIKNDFLAS